MVRSKTKKTIPKPKRLRFGAQLRGLTVRYHLCSYRVPDGALLLSGEPESYGYDVKDAVYGIEFLFNGVSIAKVRVSSVGPQPRLGALFLFGARRTQVNHGRINTERQWEKLEKLFEGAIDQYALPH